MSNNAQWQRAHRERRAKKLATMEAALRAIIAETGDKTGDAAVAIRKLAQDALPPAEKSAKTG